MQEIVEKASEKAPDERQKDSAYPSKLTPFFIDGTWERRFIEREWAQPYRRNPDLIPVFQRIYAAPEVQLGELCLMRKLVDIDEHFQLWHFRHVKTVERIIGYKRGTN
jgi:tryptophan 2,3-dioxygenase